MEPREHRDEIWSACIWFSTHFTFNKLHFLVHFFTFVPSSSLRSKNRAQEWDWRPKNRWLWKLATRFALCLLEMGLNNWSMRPGVPDCAMKALGAMNPSVPAACPFLRRKNQVLPANMLQRTACRPTEVLDPEPLRGSFLGSWWRRSCRRGVFLT